MSVVNQIKKNFISEDDIEKAILSKLKENDFLDKTIEEADSFLLSLGINIDNIIENSSTLDQLELLRKAFDTIVAKDENKEKFKVILNTLINIYEASKPDIFERN